MKLIRFLLRFAFNIGQLITLQPNSTVNILHPNEGLKNFQIKIFLENGFEQREQGFLGINLFTEAQI